MSGPAAHPGRGRWLLIPLALVVTAALALVVVWTDGPRLQAAQNPPPPAANGAPGAASATDTTRLQAEIDTLLKAEPITFEPDTAVLTGSSRGVVDRIGELLVASPAVRVEIGGHVAKTPGDEQTGLQLSKERAEAVARLIERAELPGDRITAKGYGDTRPAPAGEDDRRVEITVK